MPLSEWKRLARKSPRSQKASTRIHWSKSVCTTVPQWAVATFLWTGAWANTWLLPRWWPVVTPCACPGEDCGRGTFTHRHAVIHDQSREKWDKGTYVPLQNVSENQAPFVVIDSILSEEAVLALNAGMHPTTPILW